MALDVDRYLDRRRLKRSRGWWRIVAIFSILVIAGVGFGDFDQLKGRNHVAVIDIKNIIVDDPDRNARLKKIAADPKAKALIIRISSPGGTVVGAESLYYFLRLVGERKPVVAVMQELATSAGYMVALGADHIVARQSTITGSVGVLMQSTDITELLGKLGIKPESVKSSPLKAQPNPFEPFSKDAREVTQLIISDIHTMFINLVAERRKMNKTKATNLSNGRIYSGRQAFANGLIDSLGGEEEARQWLVTAKGIKKDVPLKKIVIQRDRHLLREILGDIVGKTMFSSRLRLDGLISLWHPVFR